MWRTLGVGVGLLLALAVATPPRVIAQASPGWILWEKNMRAKGGTEVVTWEPLDGYASIAECRLEAKRTLKYALDYMRSGAGKLLGPVRPDGRSAMFDVSKDGVMETLDLRMLCFPGSFDPRPRAA